MQKIWNAGGFQIEYKEDLVSESLLWESHCHARFEVIAVIEGDITVAIEGRACRIGAGECALLPPLVYHTLASNRQGRYHRVTLSFDSSAIPAPLLPYFSEEKRKIFVLPFPAVKTLQEAYRAPDPAFFSPLAESVMTALLYEVHRRRDDAADVQIDAELQKMLSYIDQHLCESVSLRDIAAATALSESSVCHIFKEKMRISPIQYVKSKRLALASKCIADGMPPTAAASYVGYEDYSSFYRAYKSYFGNNPSKNKD